MDKLVKRDTLQILNNTIEILKTKDEKDIVELRELSNHTIHDASVFQDETSISIAMLIYALSKIIERQEKNLNYMKLLNFLENAKKYLRKNDVVKFQFYLKKLFHEISRIDSGLKLYMQEIINQAQIKKGYKLCEHGLSCAKASEILGISQWELMNYIGKTKLNEDVIDIIGVGPRLKFTRRLFS